MIIKLTVLVGKKGEKPAIH